MNFYLYLLLRSYRGIFLFEFFSVSSAPVIQRNSSCRILLCISRFGHTEEFFFLAFPLYLSLRRNSGILPIGFSSVLSAPEEQRNSTYWLFLCTFSSSQTAEFFLLNSPLHFQLQPDSGIFPFEFSSVSLAQKGCGILDFQCK